MAEPCDNSGSGASDPNPDGTAPLLSGHLAVNGYSDVSPSHRTTRVQYITQKENSGPPMPPPVGSNWELFMENQVLHGPEEVDLCTLEPGDQLAVITKHTRYEFEWLAGGGIILRTNRADRPSGLATRIGCAFRRSGIVVPDVVFRGGKLDFCTMDGQVHHRTTIIASHTLVRQSVDCAAG